jgi:hypothetical protein
MEKIFHPAKIRNAKFLAILGKYTAYTIPMKYAVKTSGIQWFAGVIGVSKMENWSKTSHIAMVTVNSMIA